MTFKPIDPSDFLADPNRKVGAIIFSFRRETDELAREFNRKGITLKEERNMLEKYTLTRHERGDGVVWLSADDDKFLVIGMPYELDALL